jgi:peptidoglycan/LPS O-acetylase OafA/YrhL
MKKESLSYLSSLDLLRGLAALAVCFFHFTHGNPDFLSKENPLFVVGRYGFLGVEVFFVISGFVIPYSMYRAGYTFQNVGKFLGKRFIRIEPPYLLSIVMVLALNWLSTLSPYYRGEAYVVNFPALFLHLGYLNAFFHFPWYNDVYWTLAIEFQYYLIIALVFPLLMHRSKVYNYILILALSVLAFAINEHSLIFTYGLLFVAGILLFQVRIGYLSQKEFGAMLLTVLILLYIRFDDRYLVAALLPYFFITYFEFTDKVSKFLGQISYSVYLVHIPIGGRIINLSETFFKDELTRSLMVFVALAVSIFAAWVFFVVIEKPAINWSKKLIYMKPTTAK